MTFWVQPAVEVEGSTEETADTALPRERGMVFGRANRALEARVALMGRATMEPRLENTVFSGHFFVVIS
tara:strand:+ start:8249 stop:8455 length:207 start_codon:yes stop_codon:yes gene_type:complete